MSWQQEACSRSARSTRLESIAVSQDDKPLLFTCFIESNVLDIYDAISGATALSGQSRPDPHGHVTR